MMGLGLLLRNSERQVRACQGSQRQHWMGKYAEIQPTSSLEGSNPSREFLGLNDSLVEAWPGNQIKLNASASSKTRHLKPCFCTLENPDGSISLLTDFRSPLPSDCEVFTLSSHPVLRPTAAFCSGKHREAFYEPSQDTIACSLPCCLGSGSGIMPKRVAMWHVYAKLYYGFAAFTNGLSSTASLRWRSTQCLT